MPLTLNCPKCHKPFRVRDESIGGRVRCPSCGAVLQVPATLSPASNFGEGAVGEVTGNTDRPVAEDVAAGVKGTVHELLLGPQGRPEIPGLMPASHPGSGPPSIKQRVPTAPQPSPLAGRQDRLVSAPSRPQRPERMHAPEPLGPLPSDAKSWKSVRSGLGMIRFGLFLFALSLFGALAHGVWLFLDYEEAMNPGPGFLKKDDWPRWKEAIAAYTAIPLIPAILFLMLGRMRCAAAPREAHARSFALGAAFFTFLALLGGAVYFGMTYLELWDRVGMDKAGLNDSMKNSIRMTGLYAAIPSAALADILTVLFIGQIGWPLGRPQLQKGVAGFFVYSLIVPFGILIGLQFYPVFARMWEQIDMTGNPFTGQDSDVGQRVLIWGVVFLMSALLFFLRYAAIAGAAKRAIRKYVGG